MFKKQNEQKSFIQNDIETPKNAVRINIDLSNQKPQRKESKSSNRYSKHSVSPKRKTEQYEEFVDETIKSFKIAENELVTKKHSSEPVNQNIQADIVLQEESKIEFQNELQAEPMNSPEESLTNMLQTMKNENDQNVEMIENKKL